MAGLRPVQQQQHAIPGITRMGPPDPRALPGAVTNQAYLPMGGGMAGAGGGGGGGMAGAMAGAPRNMAPGGPANPEVEEDLPDDEASIQQRALDLEQKLKEMPVEQVIEQNSSLMLEVDMLKRQLKSMGQRPVECLPLHHAEKRLHGARGRRRLASRFRAAASLSRLSRSGSLVFFLFSRRGVVRLACLARALAGLQPWGDPSRDPVLVRRRRRV
jgi:hypothetical protein